MVTTTVVSILLLSLVYNAAGNCRGDVGCATGLCCSAYGYCGTGPQYCGAGSGDCRAYGCPAGQCCSQYGYCGTTAEHCGGGTGGTGGTGGGVGDGRCGATGCPAGTCCSQYGYCGTSAAHCGGVTYSNCRSTACGNGLCCTKAGYCDSYGPLCIAAKSMFNAEPASIEGEFQGDATYYNASNVSTDYSNCGTSRARSLDEGDQKIYTAALNEAQFDPYTLKGIPSTNPICQKKAIVKGAKGEIVVRFVDRCVGCKQGDIALTHDAFVALAGELGNGHIDVVWQFL